MGKRVCESWKEVLWEKKRGEDAKGTCLTPSHSHPPAPVRIKERKSLQVREKECA